jgi:hypothetical protein
MNLSITNVPIWVSLLFLCSFSTLTIYLITSAIKSVYKQQNSANNNNLIPKTILFFVTYFIAVSLVTLTGFFEKNALPPRIILATALPLFLFYQCYLLQSKTFQYIFQYIQIQQLIRIHLFRFVGVFFFLGYYYDALPQHFAFVGGGGDILTAILVLPLLYLIQKKHPFAQRFIWIWNCIGLLDILSVLCSAIWITKQAVQNHQVGVEQMGTFPFSWIPAFAPATIIFLHLLIFKKLKAEKQKA